MLVAITRQYTATLSFYMSSIERGKNGRADPTQRQERIRKEEEEEEGEEYDEEHKRRRRRTIRIQ